MYCIYYYYYYYYYNDDDDDDDDYYYHYYYYYKTNSHSRQSSQNVPAAGYLAAYNAISAAYFRFTFVRLVFRMRLFAFLLITEWLLITMFRLHTASLHPFSGNKVSSKLPV